MGKSYSMGISVLLLSTVLLFLSCSSSEEKNRKEVIVKKSDIVTKSLGIEGMTCVGCEVTLEKEISKIEGVVSVKASSSAENAVIAYDKSKTDEASIAKTIEGAGYKMAGANGAVSTAEVVSESVEEEAADVTPENLKRETLEVSGMRGVRCEAKVEEKLEGVKGVVFVEASAQQHRVAVEYDKTLTDRKTLYEAIRSAGYELPEK